MYKELYTWINNTSDKYSQKNDYIISYVISPMVHMIAKRRPSLDDSYINLRDEPLDINSRDLHSRNANDNYLSMSIKFMKCHRREPRLAYIFEFQPCLAAMTLKGDHYELSLEGEKIALLPKQIIFPSVDPISKYVINNMVPIDQFQINENTFVRCFINRY